MFAASASHAVRQHEGLWHDQNHSQPVQQFEDGVQVDSDKNDGSLPPREEWLFSGTMSKKVISATGIKWQPRFAVLTTDILAFTRQYDCNHNFLPDVTLTSETLRAAFEAHDVDHNGGQDTEKPRLDDVPLSSRSVPLMLFAVCCRRTRSQRTEDGIAQSQRFHHAKRFREALS